MYSFNPEKAYQFIKSHWENWAKSIEPTGYVVGISGGVDSLVTAALASRIFGKENVFGVKMPNGKQADYADAMRVCDELGIISCVIDIGRAYEEIMGEVEYCALSPLGIKEASYDTKTNLPARLRMSTLYAVAQSLGWYVLNTSNISESTVGYDTLWGDDAGSYAPIQDLTKTEVIALGDWLGLPFELTHKTPIDGLQPLTDEEKLGFSYADLDRYIREDVGTPEFKAKVDALYRKNKFKTEIVQIPHPPFRSLGNYVWRNNNVADSVQYIDKVLCHCQSAESKEP